MNHAAHLGAVALAVGRACGQGAGGIPDPVIATVESDDLVPPGDALGELDRRFQRIAAALGEKGDAIATQAIGRYFRKFSGQLGAPGAVDFQGMHQHFGLFANSLHHLRVAATDAADTDAGGQVDIGIAVRVLEGGAERAVHGHRHASTATGHRLGACRQRQSFAGPGAGKCVGDDLRCIRKVQGFKFGFIHGRSSGRSIQVRRSSPGPLAGR